MASASACCSGHFSCPQHCSTASTGTLSCVVFICCPRLNFCELFLGTAQPLLPNLFNSKQSMLQFRFGFPMMGIFGLRILNIQYLTATLCPMFCTLLWSPSVLQYGKRRVPCTAHMIVAMLTLPGNWLHRLLYVLSQYWLPSTCKHRICCMYVVYVAQLSTMVSVDVITSF